MNILVFTSIYPLKGTSVGNTPVVKYFCESWVKLGHKVCVISSTTRFPFVYYMIPSFITKKIENTVGFNLPNRFNRKFVNENENGVRVFQIPISKYYPGEIVDQSKIDKNLSFIFDNYLHDFIPDVAIGHWVNPQLQYLFNIKNRFKIPTSLILHDVPSKKNAELLNKYIDHIDSIGFRSDVLRDLVNQKFDLNGKKQFLCYSGVTDYFNLAENKYTVKTIQKSSLKVIYVGNMIARKYPEILIKAMNEIKDIDFELHYVGEGKMTEELRAIDCESNVKVYMHGRCARDKVYGLLNAADIFVMLSKYEAFGLVYLEAMINRTIPIASKNEGFDGIIKDGYNGFLGDAGSVDSLVYILRSIKNKSDEELYNIQRNAFETAVNMTDEKMAMKYLDHVLMT